MPPLRLSPAFLCIDGELLCFDGDFLCIDGDFLCFVSGAHGIGGKTLPRHNGSTPRTPGTPRTPPSPSKLVIASSMPCFI